MQEGKKDHPDDGPDRKIVGWVGEVAISTDQKGNVVVLEPDLVLHQRNSPWWRPPRLRWNLSAEPRAIHATQIPHPRHMREHWDNDGPVPSGATVFIVGSGDSAAEP
jgi:hypothetical protein